MTDQKPDVSKTTTDEEDKDNSRFLWVVSITLSFILALTLIWVWIQKGQSRPKVELIVDQAALESFLETQWKTRTSPGAITLPTGIFIESLRFVNPSDVHFSGYIWQRRTAGIHDELAEGFILPELVDSLVKPREEYRVRVRPEEVIGWYFEGTFRQPFDYRDYPFDQNTIWIRIWPQNFNANVVLVPDFSSYPCPRQPEKTCTGPNDIFGIDERIFLGEFSLTDTYYDYQISGYNTNFGIDEYIGQNGFPELRYNMAIQRNLEDAFTVHIVPILAVAVIGFISLMLTTNKRLKSSRFGYDAFNHIAIISALVFVLVLSQTRIGQQFTGSGLVYLELLYYLMYGMLLLLAINAYFVRAPETDEWWFIHYNDNLIPKLLYWPFLLGAAVLITAIYF